MKNDKHYCKTHAKKTDYIIPTTELYKSRIAKYKILNFMNYVKI